MKYRGNSLQIFTAFLLITLIVFARHSISLARGISESEALAAVRRAEGESEAGYEGVVEADEAGANVTTLLTTLNEAGMLLSKAKLSYKTGGYDSASLLAGQSRAKLDGFVEEVNTSTEAAILESNMDFLVNVVGSTFATILVFGGGIAIWFIQKKRSWSLEEHLFTYITITGILVLLVASPALSRLLVLPRTEFFTELWILDSNHGAEDYPFNISRNHNYLVHLGVGNHLGYCAYYLAEVKLCIQPESYPNSLTHTNTPSSLPPLFNATIFVSDEGDWEVPVTFSFDYEQNETLSQVKIHSITLNDASLSIAGDEVAWDPVEGGFFSNLFFELWLYNSTLQTFQYHERFVNLRLNMTVQGLSETVE